MSFTAVQSGANALSSMEPTADAGKDAGLGLFVGLLVLLGLLGLGSGGDRKIC